MQYSKVLNASNYLERVEKGHTVLSDAIGISRNEYYCLGVALKTYVAGIPTESLTMQDWGYR